MKSILDRNHLRKTQFWISFGFLNYLEFPFVSSAKLIYISYTMLSFLFYTDDKGLLNRCEMFKNERVLFDVMTCSPPCLSDCIKTFTFGMTIGMSKDDSWIFDTLMIAKKKNLLLFHSLWGKRTINDYKNNRQPLSCTWVCCSIRLWVIYIFPDDHWSFFSHQLFAHSLT